MRKPAKILLFDDQAVMRQTLKSLLAEQPHWQVYEAENGKTALDRVDEIKPHVAVLDVVMPEMDGVQAAYEIHQRAPETKVVLISSHYSAEEASTLARLFADAAFIPKSEAGKALIPAISRLLPEKSRAILKIST